ncbi:MAG: hypothetical protein RIG77_04660 [Cyclobacteriaceae bacterium]
MKNWSMKKGFAVVVFTLMSTVLLAGVSPEGTWEYKVPQAPYEYQTGKMLVKKVESGYEVKFNINGTEMKARNVKFSDSNLTFATYVENEYVTFKIKVAAKTMEGTVSYSEGRLGITAKKK